MRGHAANKQQQHAEPKINPCPRLVEGRRSCGPKKKNQTERKSWVLTDGEWEKKTWGQ